MIALTALGRRLVNVLWALLRDGQLFHAGIATTGHKAA